jgi:copper(I)-binding protein
VTSNLLRIKLIALWLAVLIAGCGPSGPPLTATDIVAVAPLPGREFSAAYLTLHNNSEETITINRVSSPEFAKVEIHESSNIDGVIRMRRLDSLVIDAGSSASFVSGSKHLMLMAPKTPLETGAPVTLRFEYNADGILIVGAILRNRQ